MLDLIKKHKKKAVIILGLIAGSIWVFFFKPEYIMQVKAIWKIVLSFMA